MSIIHKIYPQSIKGKFRAVKDGTLILLFIIYYVTPWLRWDRGDFAPNQAILADLPNRRGYLFNLEIWPQELYYLAGILIVAAFGLFLFTTLFGRLWCGYTCPHTVYVDVFFKIEHWIQGDRNARIKLAQQPMNQEKFIKKGLTHILWLLVAFSFAFTWVCYFYDAPTLLQDLLQLKVNLNGTLWILGLTASTYFFAGFIRDSVCTYICPYGRFQSAMIDSDTTIVTYHGWRGEPRMNFKQAKNADNPGDCIDCGKCVVVCPMNIDIREGAMQLACIGCGLCVDACNSVMEKIGRPKDLIAYDSLNGVEAKKNKNPFKRTIFKLKTWIFASVFVATITFMLYSLANRVDFSVAISRPRGQLFTIIPDGRIRNTYKLTIENRSLQHKTYEISVEGLLGYEFKIQALGNEDAQKFIVEVMAEKDFVSKVFIVMPEGFKNLNPKNFVFKVKDLSTGKIINKKNLFIGK